MRRAAWRRRSRPPPRLSLAFSADELPSDRESRTGDAHAAPGFGVALSLLASRSREAFSALHVAARNRDIRRAQLAWGALISAEWAHFVALGVFAYDHGGTTAVGVAGLMRLLPAAAIAPFASSLGDRFRRERFLFGLVPVGAAGLGVSATGALMDERGVVFVAGSVVGVCSTLFRPALVALRGTRSGYRIPEHTRLSRR